VGKDVGDYPMTIHTSCVEWKDSDEDVKAEDILNAGAKPKKKRDSAKEWLSEYLEDGEASASQVFRDGLKVGFSERTLRRAADELGVRGAKSGYQGQTMWRLPSQGATRSSSAALH